MLKFLRTPDGFSPTFAPDGATVGKQASLLHDAVNERSAFTLSEPRMGESNGERCSRLTFISRPSRFLESLWLQRSLKLLRPGRKARRQPRYPTPYISRVKFEMLEKCWRKKCWRLEMRAACAKSDYALRIAKFATRHLQSIASGSGKEYNAVHDGSAQ